MPSPGERDEHDRAADKRDRAAEARDKTAAGRDLRAAVRDAFAEDQSEMAVQARSDARDDREGWPRTAGTRAATAGRPPMIVSAAATNGRPRRADP